MNAPLPAALVAQRLAWFRAAVRPALAAAALVGKRREFAAVVTRAERSVAAGDDPAVVLRVPRSHDRTGVLRDLEAVAAHVYLAHQAYKGTPPDVALRTPMDLLKSYVLQNDKFWDECFWQCLDWFPRRAMAAVVAYEVVVRGDPSSAPASSE